MYLEGRGHASSEIMLNVDGNWLYGEDEYGTYYRCSICGESFESTVVSSKGKLWNYCPNCGAHLLEVKEDD